MSNFSRFVCNFIGRTSGSANGSAFRSHQPTYKGNKNYSSSGILP